MSICGVSVCSLPVSADLVNFISASLAVVNVSVASSEKQNWMAFYQMVLLHSLKSTALHHRTEPYTLGKDNRIYVEIRFIMSYQYSFEVLLNP